MPRIAAPTVAQHRAAQRAALLRAGEEALLEAGLAGVSPRSVCERAGLARSSFYDYFPSRDDLLVAIAIDAIERWDAEIAEALADVAPGRARLTAFVDATMAMAGDGRHEIAGALRDAPLNPSRLEDLMVLHDRLMDPLIGVLAEIGVEDPRTTAALVQGALGAGIQLVAHGVDHREVAASVRRLLEAGIVA